MAALEFSSVVTTVSPLVCLAALWICFRPDGHRETIRLVNKARHNLNPVQLSRLSTYTF